MKKKKTWLAVFVGLIIVAAILWRFVFTDSSDSSADIFTSGFIEARDVAIALEAGGRIADIKADEGDSVAAGVPLVRLDDSLLMAQQWQAEANVKLARAYLEQAIASRDGAEKAWENALDVQRNPLELDARIIAAQGELELAELDLARETGIESDWRVPAAEVRYDTAEKVLENYRMAEIVVGTGWSYDRKAKTYPAEGELALAELNLAYERALEEYWRLPIAEISVDTAQKALENLLAIRDNPQEIEAAVDQAYAAYQVAETAVAAAERQVEQAGASLEVIQVQLSRLNVSSPVSGVVAARHAEVGEIAQPGVPVLTITELEEVTLTAYVPESKIGLVKLGQTALVSVDSYPGESFTGEVVYISPRAVFTPKNVQLKEEREKMVFAVKIRLANPEQKLKPGMPADAVIPVGSGG